MTCRLVPEEGGYYFLGNVKAEYSEVINVGFDLGDIHVPKNVLRAKILFRYNDAYFENGTDIRWIIQFRAASVFTSDEALAKKLDFRRVDKFEYEKEIAIDEIQSARITIFHDEGDAVIFDEEMTGEKFGEWLNRFL